MDQVAPWAETRHTHLLSVRQPALIGHLSRGSQRRFQALQRGGIAPDSVYEGGNMKRLYADLHWEATSCVIQDRARHARFFTRLEKMMKTTKKSFIRRFQQLLVCPIL